MKHSLTSPHIGVPALFDLMVSGLVGRPTPRHGPSKDPTGPAPRVSLLDRIERSLWRSRQRELERQLESSVDAADLEDRLRRIERRMFHRYY